MSNNQAESTVPATVNQDSQLAEQEKTRADERYLVPAVDIYQTPQGLEVLADLPGIKGENLNVNVENGVLTIDARTKSNGDSNGDNYLWREFEPRNYWRQFKLSNTVDQEHIQAEFKQGVLRLVLPNVAEKTPRQIEVQWS